MERLQMKASAKEEERGKRVEIAVGTTCPKEEN